MKSYRLMDIVSLSLISAAYLARNFAYGSVGHGPIERIFEKFSLTTVGPDIWVINIYTQFVIDFIINFLIITLLVYFYRKTNIFVFAILFALVVGGFLIAAIEQHGLFLSGRGAPTGLPIIDFPFWFIIAFIVRGIVIVKRKFEVKYSVSLYLFIFSVLFAIQYTFDPLNLNIFFSYL